MAVLSFWSEINLRNEDLSYKNIATSFVQTSFFTFVTYYIAALIATCFHNKNYLPGTEF